MRRRAFTLLEVMLTVALTATVFAMIGGILLSVINTTENVTNQLKTEKAGYGILSTVQRDVIGLYAYALGGPAFKGTEDQLHFVTTADVFLDEAGNPPRLIEIGYRVEDGDNGVKVLYRRASALEGDPIRSEVDYTELYGQLADMKLEYMDAEGGWVEVWDDEEALPKAVKVVLEIALDEAQRELQQRGLIDVENPTYEMVIGIPASLGPPAEQGGGTQPQPPGAGAGT